MEIKGIPGACFQCGSTVNITRHHVIARELNPLRNVTIPLCQEHKDIMHHIVKQTYFPKSLRHRINRAYKHAQDVVHMFEAIRKELNWHTNKSFIGQKKEQGCLKIL
jgi:hypothetical protein